MGQYCSNEEMGQIIYLFILLSQAERVVAILLSLANTVQTDAVDRNASTQISVTQKNDPKHILYS